MTKAVEFKKVWEKYRVKYIRKGNVSSEEYWALKNVNFSIDKGEILGIIGKNGSGKTTILNLIAGLIMPDEGEVKVRGRVSALMELGAGFNPEFTGNENIIINARIYGIFDKQLKEKTDEIVRFADLGKFIDAPLKYYSQGMWARLAFSLSVHVDPEIFLVDDILAVGDEYFQRKCRDKIMDLKNSGKTIVVVSHDMMMIQRLCDKTLFLEDAETVYSGKTPQAVALYAERIGDKQGIESLSRDNLRVTFNNGKLFISYDGNSLSENQYSYFVFWDNSSESWISSINLAWRLLEKKEDYMRYKGVVHGRKEEISLDIELKENRINFEIDIDKSSQHNINRLHWDLLISAEYNQCLLGKNYSLLPSFYSKNEWHKITELKDVKGIGMSAKDTKRPYCIIEKRDEDRFIIFNASREENLRAVCLYSTNEMIKFSLRLVENKNIFEEQTALLYNISVKQSNGYKQRIINQCSISSGALKMSVDPDSKSINIYCDDKIITKASGLEVSFKYKGNLLNTFYSSRFSACKEGKSLVIDTEWREVGLKQRWKLYFKDSYLCWKVIQSKDSKSSVDDFKMSLLVVPEYKNFLCGFQKDSFPDEFTYWQDIKLAEPFSDIFALRRTKELPALAVEKAGENFYFALENGDFLSQCRAFHIKLDNSFVNQDSFDTRLKIFISKEEAAIARHIKYKSQKYREKVFAEYSVCSGFLKLLVDSQNKSIHFYYKDREITRGVGLFAGIKNNPEFYVMSYMVEEWKVKKINENCLELNAKETQGKGMIFTFCVNERGIYLKTEVYDVNKFYLSEYHLGIEINDFYNKWSTFYEKGDVPKDGYVSGIVPVRLGENKIDEIILGGENSVLPFLKLSSAYNNSRRISALFKKQASEGDIVCVQYKFCLFGQENGFNPGKHTIFEGNIMVAEQEPRIKEQPSSHYVSQRGKDLEFIFDWGRGKLLWKGRELTKGMGVYSSLRFKGIWYDSFQASWKLESKDKNNMVFYGKWFSLPVCQRWFMKIDGNSLFWKVDSEFFEGVNPEIEQVNIMAVGGYKDWSVSSAIKGKFDEFHTFDYDIIPFRYCYLSLKKPSIEIKGRDLARMRFSCNNEDKFRVLVENSDYFHKARLIQYQKVNSLRLPVQYTFFKGMISVAENGNEE